MGDGDDGQRDDLCGSVLDTLRSSCVDMALNHIEGEEGLYVGGIWALKRPTALEDRGITHVLSVVRCTPSETWGHKYHHMVIDVDDVEDEDLLVHLPRAVRFIDGALNPSGARDREKVTPENAGRTDPGGSGADVKGRDDPLAREKERAAVEFHEKAKKLRAAAAAESDVPPELASHLDPDAITPAPDLGSLTLADPATPGTPGAVYVHCAMGKSRSVSAVAAYLLFRHPSRFGRASHDAVRQASRQEVPSAGTAGGGNKASRAAVQAAVAHIRRTREIAEPNDGFMRQLEMWWDMGCPTAEGELESHPVYQRWSYSREVEESLAVGEAPARLRFEDEERAKTASAQQPPRHPGKELRCKKCRRVLATSTFVLDHQPPPERGQQGPGAACQHLFIEPLGWMRPTLETSELEGRLNCPNERCGANLGRYSWKGFRCSCGGWVTPAFSLARGRVDEVVAPHPAGGGGGAGRHAGPGADAERSALGIRMPAKAVGSPGRL